MAKRAHSTRVWGEFGPAMRALPTDQWRALVMAFVCDTGGHGARPRAMRAAGFARRSTNENRNKLAYRMFHDDRMIAAIAEETRKMLRNGHPEAAHALLGMIRNPEHKDHCRAVLAVIDRVDPITTLAHSQVEVTYKFISPDDEALEELRALRQLGTPRTKLLELFGGNGLSRLEKLEIADASRRADNAKVVDGEVIEVKP